MSQPIDTVSYYNQNARQFADTTVNLDMENLYQQFQVHLPKGGLILDAGCGSGRDTRYFLSCGFQVEAFDASGELAGLAATVTGQRVQTCTFLDFDSESCFDGIWACASLLHVPYTELNRTIAHLIGYLSNRGIFYCSFKYGKQEHTRGGRLFTDMDEDRLIVTLDALPLDIEKVWITADVRKDRGGEKWLNALLKKQ